MQIGAAIGCVAIALIAVTHRVHMPVFPRFAISGTPVKDSKDLAPFQQAVIADLDRQVNANIRYQDGYFTGGEPPANIGVCTDVVARSFRAAGVNLRSAVGADIRKHPAAYGINKPDINIDYRRCRNLAVFFKHHAKQLPITGKTADWQPADIVIFDCSGDGNPNHIAVISNSMGPAGIPLIVHHWPGYPVRMTELAYIPILYHFRWPYKSPTPAYPGLKATPPATAYPGLKATPPATGRG